MVGHVYYAEAPYVILVIICHSSLEGSFFVLFFKV